MAVIAAPPLPCHHAPFPGRGGRAFICLSYDILLWIKDKKIMGRQSSHITWRCLDLSLVEYDDARRLQVRLARARKERTLDTDMVLLLEHPSVFTLGRRGGLENLKVSPKFLEDRGIKIIHTERGGDITFHGPGQIVVYPILDLSKARFSVVEYVEKLEEVMIRAALDLGVKAVRKPINHGVWVGNKKLGSIGVALRNQVSFHGFALNVNLPLQPFDWINPCGLHGTSMTSVANELSEDIPAEQISMEKIRNSVKQHIQGIFDIELVPVTRPKLEALCLLPSNYKGMSSGEDLWPVVNPAYV